MAEQDAESARLGVEDRLRMERLYEEVRGRLQEMALVASRAVGVPLDDDARLQFRPDATRGSGPGGVDIEIVCTPDGCICYDYREGTCSVC